MSHFRRQDFGNVEAFILPGLIIRASAVCSSKLSVVGNKKSVVINTVSHKDLHLASIFLPSRFLLRSTLLTFSKIEM